MSGANENIASKRPASSDENCDQDFINTDTKRRAFDLTPLDYFLDSINPDKRLLACPAGARKRSANTVFINIDSDKKNESLCHNYVADYYKNLRQLEKRTSVSAIQIRMKQQQVNLQMRDQLISWIIEVAEDLDINTDTLHLTVAYIDSVLAKTSILPWALQLLGIASLFIATKYDGGQINVVELVLLTNTTFGVRQTLAMERLILGSLDFELLKPTIGVFLRRFIRAAQSTYNDKLNRTRLEHLGNYLAELAMSKHKFLRFLPSVIAASSVFLALLTLAPNARPWTPTLQFYTGYTPRELKKCVNKIFKLQSKGPTYAATMRYSYAKYKSVSNIPPPYAIQQSYFEDRETSLLITLLNKS